MPQAATAIAVLEKLLERTNAAHLAFWVTPNVVLTLAGARGYCDGVFWGEHAQITQWRQEIDQDLQILQAVTRVYMATSGTETIGEETYAGFDVIMRPGLDYALKQSNLLSLNPDTIADRTLDTIMNATRKAVAQRSNEHYDDESLSHIAFGVLLGYPDEAIIGMTKVWNGDEPGPFTEPAIPADIRGASYYLCPQPVYDYPRHLVHDENIIKHEQRWSKILEDFYTSAFHKTLAADPVFRRRVAELEML